MWPLRQLLIATLLAAIGLGCKLYLLRPSLAALLLLFLVMSFVGSLAVYALLPFRKLALPWSFGLALVYPPVYFAWQLVVSLKRAPDHWVGTTGK